MKEFFKDSPVISGIFLLMILVLLLFIVDTGFSKEITFSGTVIDKRHQSESSTTGTGYVYTNKGTAFITTHQTTPEVYQLLVKLSSGEVVKVECDATLWYRKNVNDKVNCESHIGYLSKSSWSDRGVN